MDKKAIAKKYLVSVLLLLFAGALVLFCLMYLLSVTGAAHVPLRPAQMALIAFGCALLPSGSYTGFCLFGLRIKEASRAVILALCVFFPVTLAMVTLLGIIMIIPCLVRAVITLIRG